MRLFFAGTGASEGYPGVFCSCASCQAARAQGGRNLRCRSSLMINDDVWIDPGPDMIGASIRFGLTLHKIKTFLVTHVHGDHFHLHSLVMRRKDFTSDTTPEFAAIFGSSDIKTALEEPFSDLSSMRLEAHVVTPGERWQHIGYAFQAFRAQHGNGELRCLFYSIDEGKRRVLYATDTGAFYDETWQALTGQRFDAIILEETMGRRDSTQHTGITGFLDHADRFRREGMLLPGGQMIATHFSHTANPLHDELVAFFAPHGVTVAYDGMSVDL